MPGGVPAPDRLNRRHQQPRGRPQRGSSRLFDDLTRSYRYGRTDLRRGAAPDNPWLAWALQLAHTMAESRGFAPTVRRALNRNLVMLLADHADGDVIRTSEFHEVVRGRGASIAHASEILQAMGVLVDDRPATFETWLAAKLELGDLTLFVAGSALAGLAWSAESLIVFRVIQGFGGGMILSAAMTIIARAAGPQRMGRAMSIIGVPAMLAPMLGPVVGGWLVSDFSWRWILYVNMPVGIVALALAHRVNPDG